MAETASDNEVLVAAKHLVNSSSISEFVPPNGVEYFDIMFDEHQALFSEGLETESFHPGNVGLSALDQDVKSVISHPLVQLAKLP